MDNSVNLQTKIKAKRRGIKTKNFEANILFYFIFFKKLH